MNACKPVNGSILGDGLSLEEVMEETCQDYLINGLGLEKDQLKSDFEKVDFDGNGKVSFQEATNAFSIFREGSEGWCQWDCCPSGSPNCPNPDSIVMVTHQTATGYEPCPQLDKVVSPQGMFCAEGKGYYQG